MKENTSRIDQRLKKECDKIMERRIKNKNDRKKKSIRFITEMIVRHDLWPQIKEDIINYNEK